MDEFNNSQSQSILEKAKEIERYKQECESNQNELKRMQQKEANFINQKSANDLKSKKDEVRLLYIRFF